MSADTAPSTDWKTGTASRTYGATGWADTGIARLRARSWWRRNRKRLQNTWRRYVQTVTPSGWAVLAIMVVAALLGANLGWVEAWFVAVAAATLLVLALPFLLGNRAYKIRLKIDRKSVVVGGAVQISVDVKNAVSRPALPAMAELPIGDALREISVPFIAGRARKEIPMVIANHRRGVVEIGPLTLARRDPLNLFHREVTWPDKHLLYVHPKTVILPSGSAGLVRDLAGAATKRLSDSDLSFHALRDYVRGDAFRHVHWKSTAKAGTLLVRQYEESQTARAAVIFDANSAEYASEEEFELGVSVAASLSLKAVREGRERFIAADWSTGKARQSIDGLQELPSHTPQQLLDSWAELEGFAEARPIEWLARALAKSRRPLSVVTLVTGSLPDPVRLRRAAASFASDVAIVVVRCDYLAAPAAQFADRSWLLSVGQLTDLPHLLLRGGLV